MSGVAHWIKIIKLSVQDITDGHRFRTNFFLKIRVFIYKQAGNTAFDLYDKNMIVCYQNLVKKCVFLSSKILSKYVAHCNKLYSSVIVMLDSR